MRTLSLFVSAVILLFFSSIFGSHHHHHVVEASPYSIQPTSPIPRVPFRITDEGPLPPAGTFVYISRFSSCNTTDAGAQLLNPNAATFTVALDNTKLYMCFQATNTLAYEITLQKIFLYPGWASPNTATTVTVSPALPSPAVLEFHSFATCASAVVASSTIDSTTSMSTVAGFSGIRFPCAKFTDVVTLASQSILLDSFQTFTGLGFFPNVTVIHKTETFYVSGISSDGTRIRWAQSADCTGVVSEYVLSSYQFTTTVSVARGTYHFCWDVSGSSTNWISLGTLSVLKFSSLPTQVFLNKNVLFSLKDDSPWTTTFIIADVNCQNNVFGNQFSVNVFTGVQTGSPLQFSTKVKYYVCVAQTSDTSSVVRADGIEVIDLYSITFANPSRIVRGVPATVTAAAPAPASSTYFAASDSTCSTQYGTNFTTSGYVGYLVMPTSGTGSTASTFYMCAYTADGSSFASISGPHSVVDYLLQSNTAVQGVNVGTILDGATPLPASLYLSAGSSCGAASASLANYTTTTSLALQIVYPITGSVALCYYSTATLVTRIALMTVIPKASFSPSATFVGTIQTVVISNAATSSTVIQIVPISLGSCPTFPGTTGTFIYNSSVTAAGTFSFQVTFPNETGYYVCASYANIISGTFFANLGTLNAITASILPRYMVERSVSVAQIIIPATYGPVNIQSVYLGTSASCNDASPSPIFTSASNGTVYITPPLGFAGQRWGCFHTANMTLSTEYGASKNVTIYPAVTVTFPQSYGGVMGIPFYFVFPTTLWDYMPTSYFLSTDPTSCSLASSVASGLFNTVTGQTILNVSLQQTSAPYSLCVSAPQVPGFSWLRAGNITVSKFTSVSSTFIVGTKPVIITSPSLPSPFAFFLMASSTCVGATKYTIDVSSPVSGTIPISSVYYLCAYDPGDSSWVSASSNTVKVVGAFSATIPSPVRGSVPFTATISSDIVSPFRQRVYLKAGLNQVCAAPTDTKIAEFFGTSATSVSVTIPYRTNVTLCAVSADNSTSVAVASIIPDPYTTPSEIVANDLGAISVLLGDGTTAAAGSFVYLTHSADCVFYERGPLTVVAGGYVYVDIPSSYNGPQQLYVCQQAVASGPFVVKDYIYILDYFGSNVSVSSGGFPRWGDYYWPAQPIQISIPPSVGTNPFLSNDRNCSGSDSVDPTLYGVFPPEGANTTYYVCITSKRGTLVSAPQPLRFASFYFAPQIAVTQLMTTGYFFPPLPRFTTTNNGIADPYGGTYFSRVPDCSSVVSGPFYWNISKGYVPGGSGMVYICVYPGNGKVVRAYSYYYYARATTTVLSSYPIWGQPYCLSVAAPGVTDANRDWSIWEDAVTPIPTPNPTTTRRWFFAQAGTNCSVPVTSKMKLGSPTAPFCLETTALTATTTTYDLCGPTPFGEVPYLMDKTFIWIMSNYTNGYVYGAPVTVPSTFTPSFPLGNMGWAKTADCTVRKIAADFSLDASSGAVVDFRTGSAFTPFNAGFEVFSAGYYYLCMQFVRSGIVATSLGRRTAESLAVVSGQYYPAGQVYIGRVEYYSINIKNLISFVPTTVVLQEDLYFSYIVGISTSSDCNPLDTTSTTFAAVAGDNRSAIVTHQLSTNGTRYVCARSPVNGSVYSAGPVVIHPSSFIAGSSESACSTFVVTYSDPNTDFARAGDAVITLVRGACCPSGGVLSTNLLSTSTRIPGSTPVHSFYVTRTEILAMNGSNPFSVCYRSSTLGMCFAASQMNVTQTLCTTTLLPTSGTPDPNAAPLAAGALIREPGSYVEETQSNAAVIIAAILFIILLVICIALCLWCVQRNTIPAERADKRKKNAAKVAAGENGETLEDEEQADSFPLFFAQNQTDRDAYSPRGANDHSNNSKSRGLRGNADGLMYDEEGNVDYYGLSAGLPLATTLDFCHEPTHETLLAESEERREREDIILCEQFLFEKLRRSFVSELRPLASYAVGQDRARLISHGNRLKKEERDRFLEYVEEDRADIERQEQEEFYELSLMDQEGFRNIAAREQHALNAAYQGEQAAFSARREGILRSGHGRAIEDERMNNIIHETTSPSKQRSTIRSPGVNNYSPQEREYDRAPHEDLAPPPPLVEPYQMTSPSRNNNNLNGGLNNSGNNFHVGDLPVGPGPSPPPLAVRGDPLLHFTVAPPSNNQLSRVTAYPQSPSHYNHGNNNSTAASSAVTTGRGGVAATPFRDPFAGNMNNNNINNQYSPSTNTRNPLHHPLTPNTYNQANRNNQNYFQQPQQQQSTPPHVVEDNHHNNNNYYSGGGGSYNRNNNTSYNNNQQDYDDQEMRTFGNPSHGSRPYLSNNTNNNQRYNNNGNYNNGDNFDIYRAPRR